MKYIILICLVICAGCIDNRNEKMIEGIWAIEAPPKTPAK